MSPHPRLQKRSISLAGHATSVALEAEFWAVLDAMAAERAMSPAVLIASIDAGRQSRGLASACRLTALEFVGRSGAGSKA